MDIYDRLLENIYLTRLIESPDDWQAPKSAVGNDDFLDQPLSPLSDFLTRRMTIYLALGTLVWIFFRKVICVVMANLLFPKRFAKLTGQARFRFLMNTAALFHASGTSCFFLYRYLFTDFPSGEGVFWANFFTFTYFMNDWLAAYGTWMEYPEEFFHHIIGMAMSFNGIVTYDFHGYVAPFYAMEISTVFMLLGMLLKDLQFPNAEFPCNAIFALFFTLTRVIYLPFVVYTYEIHRPITFVAQTTARWATYTVMLLQFWWFTKILRAIWDLFSGGKMSDKEVQEAKKRE